MASQKCEAPNSNIVWYSAPSSSLPDFPCSRRLCMRQYLDDHKAFHSFSEFLWPQQKTCKRVPFFTNYDLHHSTRPCGHAARRPVWPNGQAFKCFGTKPVSCSRHISAASLLATTLSSAMWHFARANNWALLLLSKVLASQNTRPPRVSTLVTAWNAQNG